MSSCAGELREFADALAEFAVRTRFDDIAHAATARLRTIFADTFAVIASGMQQPEMRRLAREQLALGAAGNASVIGMQVRSNPLDAAALNATAGVWLELDEGNLPTNGHPGIHCLPTAFALAQQQQRSGADLMLAAALGYEIGGRIGAASAMRTIVQPHGTYGVIGAAVAAAKLRRVDVQTMRRVIDIAASTPMGGNRRTMQTGATVRNWYAGHSNLMGQMALRLGVAGFTGPPDSIETTFGQVLSDGFEPAVAIEGLGHRWRLAEGYIKLYPGARHLHSAIDALRDLLARAPGGRLDPAAIAHIEARTHKLGAFCATKKVDNLFGARFSIPFALAATIVRGGWSIECYDERSVADPAVRALCQKIDVPEDPHYTAAYPGRQICALSVNLVDGSRLEGHCEIMRGEPKNPNDPAEFEDKFFALGAPIWGRALAERIYADSMRLDALGDVSEFAGGAGL
jgi:2-methylcitrate dehydratase PrpD